MEDFISNIPQAWLALIAALLGGTGLKVVEHVLNKANDQEVSERQMRNEIRSDLVACREETIRLKAEVDRWRDRYYEQIEDSLGLDSGSMKHTLRQIDRDAKER